MAARTFNLNYKRHTIRGTIHDGSAWLVAEDIGRALDFKHPKTPAHRVAETYKILLQLGGVGPRMRMLSPEGVQKLTESSRIPGAAAFMDWFQEQAMPQIALVLKDVAKAEQARASRPVETSLSLSVAQTYEAIVMDNLSLDTGRSFLYDGLTVRMQVDLDGEILFNANDVCEALELSNSRKAVSDHVDPEDVTSSDTLTPGGVQQANFINISGLYALIFGSKKEAARKFKRWVTHDVLPSIQKTGSYSLHGNPGQPSVGIGARPTRADKLALAANAAGLAASLPGQDGMQAVQIRAREELAQINQISDALRDMRIQVTFPRGFEQPVISLELPEPIDSTSAGKVLNGRVYLLELTGKSGTTRMRPLLAGEYLVKAEVDGVQYLANQSRFGLEEWSAIEEWARKKVQAEKNRA